MKKFLLCALFLLCASLTVPVSAEPVNGKGNGTELVTRKKKWFEKDPRIDVVNKNDQVTYVYDLRHSKLVKVARGSFAVDVPRGNYLVQSDKKITKTIYEVVIE